MAEGSAYALQKVIERAVRAAKAAGLEVGGIDVLRDGTIRVLTKESAKADPYANWKQGRSNG